MHLIDVSSARALLLSPPQTDMECLEFSFFVFFLKCGRLWNLNWKMIIQICRIQAKLMCDRLQSPALKPPAAGNPASSTGHAWQPTLRPMFSLGSGKAVLTGSGVIHLCAAEISRSGSNPVQNIGVPFMKIWAITCIYSNLQRER